jgi:hypothetical protein
MPPENSAVNIETVQHPTLGPLKFPSDMPYEQRNQLIENLEAEQTTARTGVETGNSQVARFAPVEQPTQKAQAGQQDGSILQRYFSSPRLPARSGLQQETNLPGKLRLPRFYGAPLVA